MFSIITPSLNQGHFIEETIQSILSQEVDLEYWVIDGGSTDQTLSILKKYQKNYPNFHYLSEPDLGQSDAINKGIRKSKGNIVAYLNSDDLYLPGTLKLIENIAKNQPNFSWFYGRSIIINERGEQIQSFFSKVKNYLGKKYSYRKLLSFNIISQPAVFIKRKVFDELGYFDINHHRVMDYEYWLRMGKKYPGFPIYQNLAKYRYYPSSISGNDFVRQYFDEFKVAVKYGHWIWDLPFMIFHFFHFLTMILWMKFLVKR